MNLRHLLFMLAVSLLPLGAAGAQTIEGDVYLVLPNGDVKPIAGNTVRLLANTDEFQAARVGLCSEYQEQYEGLERQYRRGSAQGGLTGMREEQRALMHRTVGEMTALLRSVTVAEVPTGMKAHYYFHSVRPGRYFLWVETSISGKPYQWWAAVTVVQDASLRKDLDNSALARGQLYCGIK
jgi:hypothetical protein